MQVNQNPDTVTISSKELNEIVYLAIKAKTGRTMDRIVEATATERSVLGIPGKAWIVNLAVTLKPESK